MNFPIGFSYSEDDDVGRPTLARNALSQEVTTTYDDLARTSTSINPRNETITKTFDPNGNLTGITKGTAAPTTMGHDSLDRPTNTLTPENKLTTVSYIDLSLERRELVTFPSTQQTTRHFNAGGQVDWIEDALGRINYAFDDNGNVETVTQNGISAIYLRADPLNRVTSYTDEYNQLISYGYDLPGEAAGESRTTLSYPGTNTPVKYDRDKLDRLIRITDWAGRISRFSYYDNSTNGEDGELNEITRPNNTKRKHYYDIAGRLNRVDELDANGYLIARFDLTLDAVGKVQREFRVPKPQARVPDAWTATYNNDDQFFTHSSGPVVHDPNGNLTSAPGKVGATLVNQGYSFNVRNQLTGVPTSAAAYQYNAEGHLKLRTVAGVATTYVINPVAELPQILSATTGTQTTRYIYGLGLLYEERPDGSIRSYHFDHRGNTVAIAAAGGVTVLARADYTPYGSLSNTSGALETPFLYNGRYGALTDPTTGLIHMRARWYSPYLKRFINADPAGFAGGMNFYAFAAGNPISFADPSGLGPRAFGRTVGNYLGFPIAGTIVAFTEVGRWVFPSGGSQNLASYTQFGSLGSLTGGKGAQADADVQNFPFWENPTNNALVDIVQTGWQKVGFLLGIGDSLTNTMGRSLNEAGITGGITLYGHSQGTMTSVGLVRLGYISGQGSVLRLEGPAISSAAALATGYFSGANVRYTQRVGDGIGLVNFPNIQNPLLHLAAPLDIFLGFRIHTSYDP